MNKQEALSNYIDGMGASQNKLYIGFVREFLDFATEMDRENVLRYIQWLRDPGNGEGYAAGTIELRVRTVRSLFKRNGLVWPLKRGENPQIPENEEQVVALSAATIERMVAAAMTGRLNILQTLFLALSTVFGLRRSEMAELSRTRAVSLENRTVFVDTRKGGVPRYHYIPDELVPIFQQAMPHLTYMSDRRAGDYFREIEDICDIEHVPDTGFHSIRHSLLYFLIENGVSEFSAEEFMRWAKRSRTAMARRYHKARFVGVDVQGMDLGRDKIQDEAIYKAHPFLPLWRLERYRDATAKA